MEQRTSKEVIEEFLSPMEGAVIVDVGCGDGALARLFARRGAHVTGIEVSPRALARARAAETVADERYMQGVAEDLPVKNRSVDVVVFFNSLHHVEPPGLPKALKEAARVLKHGGRLYVCEPLAEGPYFELMQPAHDESEARAKAQEVLRFAPEYGLLLEKTTAYLDTIAFHNFAAFHDRLTSINPQIRDRFVEREADIRERFEALGQKNDDGWTFAQPTRVHLFVRA